MMRRKKNKNQETTGGGGDSPFAPHMGSRRSFPSQEAYSDNHSFAEDNSKCSVRAVMMAGERGWLEVLA